VLSRARHYTFLLTFVVTLTLAASVFAASVLAVAPEAPVTEPATSLAAIEAVLNGELNPGASSEAVRYHFSYSPGETAECTESGLSTPEGGGEASGNKQKVSAPVTGLEPNREYSFCLVVFNPAEEAESAQGGTLKFKTQAIAPAVASASASSITPFAANLEAQVNPNNQPTTACDFQYGALTVSENTTPCNPESVEGFGEQTVSAGLTGLTPGAVYRFRVVVQSAIGTTEGPEQEFSTLSLEAPIVSSESTASVSSTDASVQAVVNPNYQESEYAFEYASSEQAVSEGKGTLVAGAPPASVLPAVFEEQLAGPVDLGGGLTPRTTYFYRVLARNASGTTPGPVEHFTTTGTPILTTASAQNLTRTTAVLSGAINPGGEQTTYRFAYAPAADYQSGAPNPYLNGLTTAQRVLPETDFSVHAAVPVAAIELRPGTTYHYAIVATNSTGSIVGPDVVFTTAPPTPPLAATGPAGGVSDTSATLNGSVDTRELPTVSQFEFGTAPGVGSLVPATVTPGAGSIETLTASFLGNLHPGTTYYFRTVATNADGTVDGAESSFTTAAQPSQGAPAAASLVGWPGFVLRELAAPVPIAVTPKRLTKAQKPARALKACKKKPKRRHASCRRQAKRRYR
jgi:hypothetical protein